MDWQSIFEALQRHGVDAGDGTPPEPVGGGDISAAWRLQTKAGPVFLKTGAAAAIDMFEAEADGLSELARANAVRVPAVLGCDTAETSAFLALEWLDLGRSTSDTERLFGAQLAAQHRTTRKRYGWHRDNTIGATPQKNDWSDDWVGFFRDLRLVAQLRLAAANGFDGPLQVEGAAVASGMDRLFDGYRPEASLLHGDLWGGNWAACDGRPVVFDPSVHYGDRECDLAMTRLFGGFGREFYRAYEDAWPLAEGHEKRLPLYQLYHVLNHLNLFGRSYLGRSMALIRQIQA